MSHRFVVQIDDINLQPEQVRALNGAIQQAALAHLATIDSGGDAAAVFRPQGGRTNGIQFMPVEPLADLPDRVTAARNAFDQ
jgi:hypothetical protein